MVAAAAPPHSIDGSPLNLGVSVPQPNTLMRVIACTVLLLLGEATSASTALAQQATPRGVSAATRSAVQETDVLRDSAWMSVRFNRSAAAFRPTPMVEATPARATGSVLGGVVGAFGGIGAGYGIYWHYHPKPCNDCRAPDAGAWPVLGGVLGASAGALLGWWIGGLGSSGSHTTPAR
jgi:hypothetical protein